MGVGILQGGQWTQWANLFFPTDDLDGDKLKRKRAANVARELRKELRVRDTHPTKSCETLNNLTKPSQPCRKPCEKPCTTCVARIAWE